MAAHTCTRVLRCPEDRAPGAARTSTSPPRARSSSPRRCCAVNLLPGWFSSDVTSSQSPSGAGPARPGTGHRGRRCRGRPGRPASRRPGRPARRARAAPGLPGLLGDPGNWYPRSLTSSVADGLAARVRAACPISAPLRA
jgi:hypothetical protein